MPLTTDIVHSRLMGELRHMQRQRCSIFTLADPPAQDSLGDIKQVWPDDYTVVPGHDQLPCTLAVTPTGKKNEQRQADSRYVSEQLACLLDGLYPLITEQMIARVDGVAYDIKGVSQQSTLAITRLALERIA